MKHSGKFGCTEDSTLRRLGARTGIFRKKIFIWYDNKEINLQNPFVVKCRLGMINRMGHKNILYQGFDAVRPIYILR